MNCPKDCLSCSNSMSTEDNKLYCVIKLDFVEEDYCCEHYI